MRNVNWLAGGAAALFIGLGLAGPMVASAATSPSLGTAASYSILAGSSVTNTGATTISGDVGISPGAAPPNDTTGFGTVTMTGGTVHDGDAAALTAQGDRDTAFSDLGGQGCTLDYGGIHELAGDSLAPGVYCATQFTLTNGTLTLSGTSSDVWIFKSASSFNVTGSSADVVFSGGGLACNVWWRVVSGVTIDVGSTVVGNILAGTSVTFGAGATLDGRALASTALVSTDSTVISGPTCSAPPSGGGSSTYTGTITVVKTVVNDNGGTRVISDFPLFINGVAVVSGQTNNFSFSNNAVPYTVSETSNAQYAQTFSGDCDSSGLIYLEPSENTFCIITNNDIGAPVVVPPVPPLIDVVKVPNPLALPLGPGSVTYTYTTRNIGTVAMSNVTMVGDSCAPITRISGDTDGDNLLDVSETWTYTCTATLTATHTNTVVATGWANGLSATDIASATVVVGVPIVPPLIHVTKVPSPLTLLAGGGNVTYTEKITNPGTVALSGVTLTDDRCSPLTRISGDANGDSLLDPTETWTYTCSTNLTATTTNTATATGSANGITVRDFAIATVVVAAAVPTLPNTGVTPEGSAFALIAIALAILAMLRFVRKQETR